MWSHTGKHNREETREDGTFDGRQKEDRRATASCTTDLGLKHTCDMWRAPGSRRDIQECSWGASSQKNKSEIGPQPLQHTCSSGNQAWVCYICGSEFSTISSFEDHINSAHMPGSKRKCNSETLQSNIPGLSSQPTPVQTHPIERIFPCSFCEKNFTTKAYMNIHMRVHTGDKPYKCQMCDKAFSQHGTLKNHIRTHTGEKPFVCEFCEMSFTSKGNMITHTRIHTAHKPYECQVCEKKFSQLGSLKVHMRKHTGERPFECPMCGMKCITKGNLKTHLYTHTGEKPHKCEVCRKEFSQKGSLKTHMKTHNP
ncbi:PREDICTED: zinc finger protein 239-like [Branchiostoma belcheri]|uniref:Zinc finger protein 239-like n=1 Tax=Branchiostoma belcheri TaxID=7741 RepID=A0A6P4XUZ2_BRABE|nr:PREDICTED: zinc finger protein 239-like [Branchiostoma belcheri]